MVNNNYPQITSVTSESLQAQIRNLLPSQEGFGTDLMAQNVIVPIIDLTAVAEGSTVPQNLQTAIAFGSQTAFSANGSTDVIANIPGFYRIFGVASSQNEVTGGANTSSLTMTDGLSVKTIWALTVDSSGTTNSAVIASESFDFVVFLASGQSISAVSSNIQAFVKGSSRQIADVSGNLVNPLGFTPQ